MTSAMTPGMTPEFSAFCLMNRDRYSRYTRCRVGDADVAARVVGAVFDELAVRWPDILRGSSTAAAAWRILGAAVAAARTVPVEESAPCGALHRLLPGPQADAVLLHYHLGLTLTSTAELMGADPSVVAAHVLAAERSLPPHLVKALERPPAGA